MVNNTDAGTTTLSAILEDGDGASTKSSSVQSFPSDYVQKSGEDENLSGSTSASASASSSDDDTNHSSASGFNCDLAESAFALPPIEDLDDNGVTYVDNLVDDQK